MPMKISKIEFENFRNFKDHGEIRCSTDGKVTIIYGRIGDGKTTLHQLVQWVFYGRVHFNKTATDRLYNLQYENPFVSPRDSEARVDSFDALWKHSVGVIACIKLITLWGHTLQNDSVIDVGV